MVDMKHVLITGGQGMLATDLDTRLSQQFQVCSLSHADLEVRDAGRVAEVMQEVKPEVVIHTAALHVDWCEEHSADAFQVNAWATRSLAMACQRSKATLVYISTCGLFGDEMKAYTEYDPVVLKTVYARSKYQGELFVQQFCQRHFIVRPGWLFGGGIHHAKNFVIRRYEEAQKLKVMHSAFDKYGSPTYTGDLARGISELLKTEEYGTYHLANQGGCSRATYVRRIIEGFGCSTRVEEVDSSHYPRKADVPGCEILDGLNIRFLGLEPQPPWDEALQRYISALKTATLT